jgi:hypothetical protein
LIKAASGLVAALESIHALVCQAGQPPDPICPGARRRML